MVEIFNFSFDIFQMALILLWMIGKLNKFNKYLIFLLINRTVMHIMAQPSAFNWLMSSGVRLTISWSRDLEAHGLIVGFLKLKFMHIWRHSDSPDHLLYTSSAMCECVMEDVRYVSYLFKIHFLTQDNFRRASHVIGGTWKASPRERYHPSHWTRPYPTT